ncbi:MBL fold metallo-hydrolase [Myxococcota bacterium]|nr:MBL fold metallo-hydrolase [Myxococcota bacterium]
MTESRLQTARVWGLLGGGRCQRFRGNHLEAKNRLRVGTLGWALVAFWVQVIGVAPSWVPPSHAETTRALDEVTERAWDFGKTPVALEQVDDGVWRTTGVTNAYLVEMPGGNVLIDTSLPHQAARSLELLESVMKGPLKFIVLTHAHVDHIGGAKLWLSRHPNAKVIAHEAFPAMQHNLEELAPYFARRGRMAMPNLVAAGEAMREVDPLFTYGGIEPDILIDDDEPLTLEFGDRSLEVLPMPGGEGPDGLTVWLPDQRILFTGDLTGPHFPAFPNLYSVRGERYREFLPYVRSVDRALKLEPAVIAHGHFDVIRDENFIREALMRQRDAVKFVHDQTVAGMNAGKSLPELMSEVNLPPELALSQGYGTVAWSLRGLWETYTGWFDFESTTGLYPVPVRDVYPDLVEAAGGIEPILTRAQAKLEAGRAVEALHLVEVAESVSPGSHQVLRLKRRALEILRERALAGHRNFYEVSWLDARLGEVRAALGESIEPGS